MFRGCFRRCWVFSRMEMWRFVFGNSEKMCYVRFFARSETLHFSVRDFKIQGNFWKIHVHFEFQIFKFFSNNCISALSWIFFEKTDSFCTFSIRRREIRIRSEYTITLYIKPSLNLPTKTWLIEANLNQSDRQFR